MMTGGKSWNIQVINKWVDVQRTDGSENKSLASYRVVASLICVLNKTETNLSFFKDWGTILNAKSMCTLMFVSTAMWTLHHFHLPWGNPESRS